jgi:antirestriction protein ArdC
VQPPADLETVRESYDRVADAYVELAAGRLEAEPWLRPWSSGNRPAHDQLAMCAPQWRSTRNSTFLAAGSASQLVLQG